MPDIIYAEALAPLEKILAQVERPGDFYATGAVETRSASNTSSNT